ncbi:hypothetical protein HDV00_004463 [Rhizophlyctis rosea]|nr:hypothetical protein HDV00_004463 [Rhizophlyctis rosea]
MSIRTIFIVRHGIRQDFLTPEFTSPTGRPHDPPLADDGHKQAEDLADHLVKIGPNIKYIISSPFSRCLQTIEPYAKRTGIKVKIEEGIGEWFNAWGKESTEPPPHPHPTKPELHRLFPSIIDPSYTPINSTQPSWETSDQVHTRFAKVLAALIPHIEQLSHPESHHNGDLLLVTHAAGMITAVRALIGDSKAPVNCGVASVAKLRRRSDSSSSSEVLGAWEVEMDGDTSHLPGGTQYNWKFWEDRLVEQDEPET